MNQGPDTQDALVSAMTSGAGLPVLSILDEYLTARSDGRADEALEAHTLEHVLDEVDAWIEQATERIQTRLAGCDAGPLVARMDDHLTRVTSARRQALDDILAKADRGSRQAAWAQLEAEFLRLHTLRDELAQLHRAARRLQEVAELIVDIPQDDEGQAALDTLAEKEALAATHPTPSDWAKAAKELEGHCLEHVRFETPEAADEPAPDTATETDQGEAKDDLEDLEITWLPGQATSNGHDGQNGHNGHDGRSSHHGNNGNNGQNGGAHTTLQEARGRTVEAGQPSKPQGASPLQRFMRQRSDTPTGQGEAVAGRDVLQAWRKRFPEADRRTLNDRMRHGPLWAPIADGTVPAPSGSKEELLELAQEVEIDLVDIELPRILALPTGRRPEDLHASLADRAEAITRKDPKRVAREAYLDYVVGKLPKRYRATADGLALIESISHALCKDEPWEASDHDFGTIVANMVERELARTPAIDIQELATSLIGDRPEALEIVAEAAERLAEQDDDVSLHPDGIIVRALAEREDPDKLYKLRASLEARLGKARASQLIRTLVTTEGEQP